MTLSFDAWVRDQAEERDLTGYARERVEEALRDDETLAALWEASHAADDRQSSERDYDSLEDSPEVRALVDARRACDDALDTLADAVVSRSVRMEIHGHSVDLRHARRVDCPACGEDGVEAFYLGTATVEIAGTGREAVGWVCGHCGEGLVEDVETETVLVDSPDVDESEDEDGDALPPTARGLFDEDGGSR